MYHGCLPVREIVHPLKLVHLLLVQTDKSWDKYYIGNTRSVLALRRQFSPNIDAMEMFCHKRGGDIF